MNLQKLEVMALEGPFLRVAGWLKKYLPKRNSQRRYGAQALMNKYHRRIQRTQELRTNQTSYSPQSEVVPEEVRGS